MSGGGNYRRYRHVHRQVQENWGWAPDGKKFKTRVKKQRNKNATIRPFGKCGIVRNLISCPRRCVTNATRALSTPYPLPDPAALMDRQADCGLSFPESLPGETAFCTTSYDQRRLRVSSTMMNSLPVEAREKRYYLPVMWDKFYLSHCSMRDDSRISMISPTAADFAKDKD